MNDLDKIKLRLNVLIGLHIMWIGAFIIVLWSIAGSS